MAVLPALAGITGNSYLHPALLAHGFRMRGRDRRGVLRRRGRAAAFTIRNPSRAVGAATTPSGRYCALEAPPLRSSRTPDLETAPVTIPADPEGLHDHQCR